MTAENQPKLKRKLPRICIGIYIMTAISAVLYFIFTKNTAFSDWFNQTISRFGRRILAYLSCYIPFSVAELLILLIPFLLVLFIVIGCKRFCDTNRSVLVYIGILLSGICVIGILFVWNFAAGYYGTALDQKLSLDRQKSSAEELFQTAELLSAEMQTLSDEIVFLEDGSSLMPYSYDKMNDKLLCRIVWITYHYGACAFIDEFFKLFYLRK